MTNQELNWINVRYSDVSKTESNKKQGLTIRFMTTPQDVPTSWRHTIRETSSGRKEAFLSFVILHQKSQLYCLKKMV